MFLAIDDSRRQLRASRSVRSLLVGRVARVADIRPTIGSDIDDELEVLPMTHRRVLALSTSLALRARELLCTIDVGGLSFREEGGLSQ